MIWTKEKPKAEGDYWRWAPGWRGVMYEQVTGEPRLKYGLYIHGEERDEYIADINDGSYWMPVEAPPIPTEPAAGVEVRDAVPESLGALTIAGMTDREVSQALDHAVPGDRAIQTVSHLIASAILLLGRGSADPVVQALCHADHLLVHPEAPGTARKDWHGRDPNYTRVTTAKRRGGAQADLPEAPRGQKEKE